MRLLHLAAVVGSPFGVLLGLWIWREGQSEHQGRSR